MSTNHVTVRALCGEVYARWLPRASHFYRATGYFSVAALSAGADAYAAFFSNKGQMRLLTGEITPHDALYDDGSRTVGLSASDYRDYPVSCFRKLLEGGLLVVKVATPRKRADLGIFHTKYGVLAVPDEPYVSFQGSANETKPGIGGYNYEESLVYSGSDDTHAHERLSAFQTLWDDKDTDWRVNQYNFPDRDADRSTLRTPGPSQEVLQDNWKLENWRLEHRITRSEARSLSTPVPI